MVCLKECEGMNEDINAYVEHIGAENCQRREEKLGDTIFDEMRCVLAKLWESSYPSPTPQDLLETRVFAQFRKMRPILACNQRGIANRRGVLRKAHRIVLLPGGVSCHS